MFDPIMLTAGYWDFWIVQGFFLLATAERIVDQLATLGWLM